MPSTSIATGTPSTLSLNNTCPHINSIAGIPPDAEDPPHIGLYVGVKVVPASTGLAASGFTRKLTYGPSNIPMISMGVIDCAGDPANGWLEVFYLHDVVSGNGAASVVNYINRDSTDTSNAAVKSIQIDTITYSRVDQITPGSLQMISFSGGAANLFINSAKSKFAVGFFTCSVAITAATSGTQKVINNLGSGIGNAANSSIIDIDGDSVVQLTANNGSTGNWGFIGFSIDFIQAANADYQATNDVMHGALMGTESSGTSQGDLQLAVSNQFNNIVANGAGLEVLQQPNDNSSLINVAVDFRRYPDQLSLPVFITSFSGGDGHYIVENGIAVWQPTTNEFITFLNYRHPTPTKTNFQLASVIFTAPPKAGTQFRFFTRASTSVGVGAVLYLGCTIDGQWDTCAISGHLFSLPYIPGATYSFRAGTEKGADYFQVLINGAPQPIKDGTDIDVVIIPTTTGASKRFVSFTAVDSPGSVIDGPSVGYSPPNIAWFGFQDQVPFDPPVDGWTAVNASPATLVQDSNDMLLTVPNTVSGESAHMFVRPLTPASNYTFQFEIDASLVPLNVNLCGIVLRDSVSGQLITLAPEVNSGVFSTGMVLAVSTWTSLTTRSTFPGYQGTMWIGGLPRFLQIRDDGTNRYYEYSLNDGADYITLTSEPRGTFITPNQIGLVVYNTLTTGQGIPVQPLKMRLKSIMPPLPTPTPTGTLKQKVQKQNPIPIRRAITNIRRRPAQHTRRMR